MLRFCSEKTQCLCWHSWRHLTLSVSYQSGRSLQGFAFSAKAWHPVSHHCDVMLRQLARRSGLAEQGARIPVWAPCISPAACAFTCGLKRPLSP